ncbi:thioredoxin family protein [Desulfovibrio sp. OttesenSCG-928-C06]|nr:thioredoxin family protein [Desulfovibrio sp. OttesenSCG-928-C06]
MFTQLTGADFDEKIGATEAGVLIFFKKLCPHCKNMEKVLEKFSAQRPNLAFFNVDIEEETEVAQKVGAERPPTTMIIKGGKIVGQRTGLFNPKEMAALYDSSN